MPIVPLRSNKWEFGHTADTTHFKFASKRCLFICFFYVKATDMEWGLKFTRKFSSFLVSVKDVPRGRIAVWKWAGESPDIVLKSGKRVFYTSHQRRGRTLKWILLSVCGKPSQLCKRTVRTEMEMASVISEFGASSRRQRQINSSTLAPLMRLIYANWKELQIHFN